MSASVGAGTVGPVASLAGRRVVLQGWEYLRLPRPAALALERASPYYTTGMRETCVAPFKVRVSMTCR